MYAVVICCKCCREVEVMIGKGNQKFKLGRFEIAADLYTQGINKCPLCAKKKLIILYRLVMYVPFVCVCGGGGCACVSCVCMCEREAPVNMCLS